MFDLLLPCYQVQQYLLKKTAVASWMLPSKAPMRACVLSIDCTSYEAIASRRAGGGMLMAVTRCENAKRACANPAKYRGKARKLHRPTRLRSYLVHTKYAYIWSRQSESRNSSIFSACWIGIGLYGKNTVFSFRGLFFLAHTHASESPSHKKRMAWYNNSFPLIRENGLGSLLCTRRDG